MTTWVGRPRVGSAGFPRPRQECYDLLAMVEVQQTFYHPLPLRTARALRQEAPLAFDFMLRAWLLITHEPTHPSYRRLRFPIPDDRKEYFGAFQDTDEVWAAWQKTDEVAQALRARVIFFQTPPRFEPTPANVARVRSFFGQLERRDYLLAWDPRGNWPAETLKPLCDELDLIHAVDPFVSRSLHGRRKYYRLTGMGDYRYQYTEPELDKLAALLRKNPGAYCLFANHYMFEDAKRLLERLTATG
ncbi:MAG: DUF72 domain-containing protein [bacterium]|nr:DUF72 domain-containing protein [bacterium]